MGGAFNGQSTVTVDKGATFNDIGKTTAAGDFKVAGTFNLQAGGSFNENGTMEVSGAVTVGVGADLIDAGRILLATGSTFLDHGHTTVAPGGLFDESSLATVTKDASFNVAGANATKSSGALTIESSGMFSVAGVDMTVEGAIYDAGDLSVEGGGVVNLSPSSTFYNSNHLEVQSGGTLVVASTNATVAHGGSVADTGSIVLAGAVSSPGGFLEDDGALTVNGGGSFHVQQGATLKVDNGGSFEDAGTCTVNAGGFVEIADNVHAALVVELVVDFKGTLDDYGTVQVDQSATATIKQFSSLDVFQGGLFDAHGTCTFQSLAIVDCGGTFHLESGTKLEIDTLFQVNPTGNFIDDGLINLLPAGTFSNQGGLDGAYGLSVTAPTAASVGVPFSLTLTMLTKSHTVATAFTDTVSFTSTDPTIVGLPGVGTSYFYRFSSLDLGVHTFMGVVLNTPEPQSIRVFDGYDVNLKFTVQLTVSAHAESLGAIAARPTTGVQPFIQGLATLGASNPSSAIYVSSAPSTGAQPAPAFPSLPATMTPAAPLAGGTAASLDDNHIDNFFARAQISRRHTPVASPRQRTTSSEDWLVL